MARHYHLQHIQDLVKALEAGNYKSGSPFDLDILAGADKESMVIRMIDLFRCSTAIVVPTRAEYDFLTGALLEPELPLALICDLARALYMNSKLQ